ncbi:MAG: hypothetical protein J5972_00875, partial [Eubacterium sp.]|nr:hypothetical protein [Eubacterium sp.]
SEFGLIGYGRFDEKEKAFVLVQTGGGPREVEVEVWRLGMNDGEQMATMMSTDQNGFSRGAQIRQVENGCIRVTIGENGAVLWKSIKNFL